MIQMEYYLLQYYVWSLELVQIRVARYELLHLNINSLYVCIIVIHPNITLNISIMLNKYRGRIINKYSIHSVYRDK